MTETMYRFDPSTWIRAYGDAPQLIALLDLHARGYGAKPGFAVEVPENVWSTLHADIKQHFRRVTPQWSERDGRK